MDERRTLAYHEAGHIVVGYVLGLEIQSATIVSDGKNAGRAGVPVDLNRVAYDSSEEGDYMESQLACYLAGAVAEEVLTGEEIEFRPGGEYAGDWNGAADCVVELAGADEDLQSKVSERAFDSVRRILLEHWSIVDELAGALLRNGSLDRKQLMKIVQGAPDA